MPGPPPKPTYLKLITGNPGKRKLNKNEPKPTAGILPVPDHLSDEAKAEWTRIASDLNAIGLLTHVDRAALAAYCQAWANWVEAEELEIALDEVEKNPAPCIDYGPLPAAASQPANYAKWGRELASVIQSNRRLQLFKSPKFGHISAIGESEGDFRVRLQLAARERRDQVVQKEPEERR